MFERISTQRIKWSLIFPRRSESRQEQNFGRTSCLGLELQAKHHKFNKYSIYCTGFVQVHVHMPYAVLKVWFQGYLYYKVKTIPSSQYRDFHLFQCNKRQHCCHASTAAYMYKHMYMLLAVMIFSHFKSYGVWLAKCKLCLCSPTTVPRETLYSGVMMHRWYLSAQDALTFEFPRSRD